VVVHGAGLKLYYVEYCAIGGCAAWLAVATQEGMEAGYRGLRITKLGEEEHEASVFEVFLDASAERQRWPSPLHIWIGSSLPSGICSSTVLAQTGRDGSRYVRQATIQGRVWG